MRVLAVALLSCALQVTACAPSKDGEESIKRDANPQASFDRSWDWNWKGLRDLIRAFHENPGDPRPVGVNRDELHRLWSDYGNSAVLRPRGLSDRSIQFKELLGTAMAFDTNGDNRVSSVELEGMEDSPVLRWLPPGQRGRSCGELSDLIWRESSMASTAAINELARAICWLDAKEFGGDGDFLVSREELGTNGWFQAVWKASFSLSAALKDGKGSPPPAGSSGRWNWLWPRAGYANWLERLISQQAFGRYSRWESADLKEADRRLEWVALSLRGYIARHVTHAGTGTEGIPQSQLWDTLRRMELSPEAVSREARLWYDHPWARTGGKHDQELDWKEAFYLLVDAEFVKKFVAEDVTHGDFRLERWDGVRSRDAYWQALFRTTPRIRNAWGLNTGNVSDPKRRRILQEFWETFQSFDRMDHQGDGNGYLGIGEVLLAWNSARVVETWLERFDVNRSGILEPAEAEAFTRAVKKTQPGLLKDNPFTETESVSDLFSWFRYIGGASLEVPTSVFTLDVYIWLTRSLPRVR